MIEQFLNREFMLDVAEGARAGLAREVSGRSSRRRAGPSALDNFSTAELEAVAEELAGIATELGSAGAGDDAPLTSAATQVAPRDDFVFLPHHQMMSILQSAVEEAVEEHQPDSIEQARVVSGRRAGTGPVVTSRRLKGIELSLDAPRK